MISVFGICPAEGVQCSRRPTNPALAFVNIVSTKAIESCFSDNKPAAIWVSGSLGRFIMTDNPEADAEDQVSVDQLTPEEANRIIHSHRKVRYGMRP